MVETMNTEQKAKAYDEALERAKKVHKYSSDLAEIKRMEEIFPELAESEDERIKKEFCEDIWTYIPNEKAHKYIAWLEKQTNTIPNECVFRPLAGTDIKSAAKQAIEQQGVLAKEIVLAFNGAYIPVKGKAQDIIVNEYNSWLEKQGEQKPAEWSEEDEIKIKSIIAFLKSPSLCAMDGNKGIIDANIKYLKSIKDRVQLQPKQEWKQENREELTEFENAMMHIGGSFFGENAGLDPNDTAAIKEQAELLLQLAPKTEWSEEDKEFINDLIGVFDGQQYQAHSDEEIVKWLKSIRPPYNKEWDENDEEMLKSIIATCELAYEDRNSSPARHLLQMQTDWLKSLKERHTWKPSEKQIEALEDEVRNNKTVFRKKVLNELLEQLKKL